MASSGLLQAKAGASEDIKASTGQYNASLGMTSNERSGKAILARQREGDVGTYHYGDNLARGVRHIVRQLVDLIPKVYDTQRVARIIGIDGETKMVKLNPDQPEAVNKIMQGDVVIEKIYNPSVGKYDVVVATGPGYATKRQEALEAMAQLLQGNPQLWSVAGDLFVKNMDWPGAQEMAKRFAKTIDPKLMDDSDKPPELQAAEQQIQAMGQELDQLHGMLTNVGKSIEAQDMQRKDFEAEIKLYQAETQRISAVQAGMTEQQIQDIAMGVVAAAMESQNMVNEMPEMPQQEMTPPEQEMMPPEQQMGMPQ
jgi:hypothetical protein